MMEKNTQRFDSVMSILLSHTASLINVELEDKK
jgi:hypothetical protein